jgi:FkbM family methyltransferase
VKIAFITPHLSTGGMPQYLNNKIEKLKEDCDIWVFEKSHEPSYNTIRLRIEKQIGKERIITWGNNPIKNLLDRLDEINPDIIHFEEPCEQFLSENTLRKIFRKERRYKIFETFHDSSLEIEEKRFLPDKFIVVSPWQVYLLRKLGVPSEVIEHEIPSKPKKEQELARKILGLDPTKKHVIQVGIFTPRKNQKETAELARSFPDVQFHFIGTVAENYKFYWESILKNLPSNCKIWGERDDVDLFYQAADMSILPSLPLFNDKETSPLVIKESLEWGTPLLMRDIKVYVDMFQESNMLRFMGQTKEETVKIISQMLNTNPSENNKILDLWFESDSNKINITYLQDKPLGTIWASVKDRDSNACIYGFDLVLNSPGISYWVIPIPKDHFDFNGDKNFSGFELQLYYSKDEDIPFYRGTIELKRPIRKKRIPNSKHLNFDPIFVNYTQFFVDWIYNGFFAGARIKKAIDIGANVGLFTQWVLDRFGSDTEVIGIEPNTSATKAFEFLHSQNPTVNLEKLAVSGKSGERITMRVNPGNTLISSFEGTGDGYTEDQEVSTITLVDLLKKYNWEECDLLKVDVEGAEYEIFDSVSSDDLKKFKYLLIEFHNNQGRVKSLIQKIKEAGFSIDVRDDDTRFEVNEDNDRGTIFATRII